MAQGCSAAQRLNHARLWRKAAGSAAGSDAVGRTRGWVRSRIAAIVLLFGGCSHGDIGALGRWLAAARQLQVGRKAWLSPGTINSHSAVAMLQPDQKPIVDRHESAGRRSQTGA